MMTDWRQPDQDDEEGDQANDKSCCDRHFHLTKAGFAPSAREEASSIFGE